MTAAATVAEEEVVPGLRRRMIILGVASMGFLMAGLDSTILNVALPTIQRSFHSSLPSLQWTVDAYTLVLASLLMLSGSLADRFGRRRIFQLGQVLFTLGSLLCALAPNVQLLIAFRVVQALGGTMLNPVSNAIVRNTFNDTRERQRAFGIMSATSGLSMALGPVLGGFLLAVTSWRVLFLINLPVGVVAVFLTARFVPHFRTAHVRRFDPVGQLLVIAALSLLTYAIIEGEMVLLACSVACFVGLVLYELRRREPLLDVRFFTSVPFAGAITIAVFLAAAVAGFLFTNTIYLQDARGLSPLYAALYMLPMAITMAVCAPLSGRMTARFGARPSLTVGGLALAAGGLMLTVLRPETSMFYLFGAYVLLGVGSALCTPPITNVGVTVMPSSQAGVAAAVTTTSRQSGSTLGVALFGAIAGSGISGKLDPGFAAATHPVWWIIVAIGLVTVVLFRAANSPWAMRTAQRTADRLRDPDDPAPARPGRDD